MKGLYTRYLRGEITHEEYDQKKGLHVLERTSPKGSAFIGRCVLCGKENISFLDFQSEECPNPKSISQEDAIITAIEGSGRKAK